MEEERIKSFKVDNGGIRIDHFLSTKIDNFSRTKIKKLIKEEKILINNFPVKPSYIISQGEVIDCDLELVDDGLVLETEEMNLDIIYEDDNLVAINKPAGLVVHPGHGNKNSTLVNGILHYINSLSNIDTSRPGIVHRLDKDTS